MSSSIRFPIDLRPPDRNGYADQHEQIKTRVEMEAGPSRLRRRMRIAPRVFSLRFEFTQLQFTTFDAWWQDVIGGGKKPFDIELLDDDQSLIWFTVTSLDGTYKAAISDEFDQNWIVTLRVRSIADPFVERTSGADELRGSSFNTSGGTGELLISIFLRGQSTIESINEGRLAILPLMGTSFNIMSNTGRLLPIGLRGLATIESLPTGQFTYLNNVLSKEWMGLLAAPAGDNSVDANDQARRRSYLGI